MNDTEFATTTAALPERYADRLPTPELDGLRAMASGGEWDELLDLLVATLLGTGATITPDERDQLAALLHPANMPSRHADVHKLPIEPT